MKHDWAEDVVKIRSIVISKYFVRIPIEERICVSTERCNFFMLVLYVRRSWEDDSGRF